MRYPRMSILMVLTLGAAILLATFPAQAVLTKVQVEQVTWEPEKPKPGSVVNFHVYVKNEHTENIKLKKVSLHFDWHRPGEYDEEDMSSSPVTVLSKRTYRVDIILTIPSGAEYDVHPYTVRIEYSVGDSSYGENSNEFSNFVLQKKTEKDDEGMNPLENPVILGGVIGASAIVILIVAVLLIRRKRKKEEKIEKRKRYKSALSSEEGGGDVELAETVVDRRRPSPVSSRALREKREARRGPVDAWDPGKSRVGTDTGVEDRSSGLQQTRERSIPKPASVGGTMTPSPDAGQEPVSQPHGPLPTPPPPRGQKPPPPPPPPPKPTGKTETEAPVQQRPEPPPPLPPKAQNKSLKNKVGANQCPVCGTLLREGMDICPRCSKGP